LRNLNSMFQFHNGSIKGLMGADLSGSNLSFNSTMVRLKVHPRIQYVLCTMFQFHNGSIKGLRLSALQSSRISFNSTMVRLKGILSFEANCPTAWFQFHNGSIKGDSPISFVITSSSFNSTMVRLKVGRPRIGKQKDVVSIPQWFD